MRIGQVFAVGKEVVIRITRVRGPCRTISVYGSGIIKAIYNAEVKSGNIHTPKWGRSGFYAEVLKVGTVYPGDSMALQSAA